MGDPVPSNGWTYMKTWAAFIGAEASAAIASFAPDTTPYKVLALIVAACTAAVVFQAPK